MFDKYNRNIDYLRISVTDRCNLKCIYCMPENEIKYTDKSKLLTFEEIEKLCWAASKIGITKIKITGGEPLIRKNISDLIYTIKRINGIKKVTLTTNGILLSEMADSLYNAGTDSINISLDSLNKYTYSKITRCDNIENAVKGLKASIDSGIKTKLNCVAIENINDNEITDIALLAESHNLDVRFIELMPIGYGKKFNTLSNNSVKQKIEKRFGNLTASNKIGNGPAKYFKINGFKGNVGFISAVSHSFCDKCNRIRLTCGGDIKLCLNYDSKINIKEKLRKNNFSDYELSNYLKTIIYNKPLCHNFYSSNQNKNCEFKNMIQIGG